MADFVAVLKKTIDGLGDATPETRERVYAKARATVAAKLAAISPPPAEAVIERQKKSLEDAIAAVEADYAPPPPADPEPADDLEEVFASLDGSKPVEAAPAKTAGSSFEVTPVEEQQTATAEPFEAARAEPFEMDAPEAESRPVYSYPDDKDADDGAEDDEEDTDEEFEEPLQRRRSMGGLIAALVLLALLAGGGYAAWLNKNELQDIVQLDKLKQLVSGPAENSASPAKPGNETAAVAPQPAPAKPAAPDAPAAPAQPEKFTQRLNADGTEVDEGPGQGAQTIGEGTSVTAVTQPLESAPTEPEPANPPPSPDSPDGTPAPEGPTAQPLPGEPTAQPSPGSPEPQRTEQPAVAVGQKAIFYEERTTVAQGSADTGSIVWSVVQESPGGDLPPEPAIRAEATIPGKELQLRMTIRRNADPTLPASHIIEMIFLTPEGFEGGGIENILRVSLKDSEQAAGSALLGIPAKIADGFFLVALNDTKPEMDANLNLLRRQQWIDVPLVYKSGRRALITMEKGIPGEKVFDEAMKAWQTAASGSSG